MVKYDEVDGSTAHLLLIEPGTLGSASQLVLK